MPSSVTPTSREVSERTDCSEGSAGPVARAFIGAGEVAVRHARHWPPAAKRLWLPDRCNDLLADNLRECILVNSQITWREATEHYLLDH